MLMLDGAITISRPSGRQEDYVRIELIDADAHCIVVNIELSPTEFANAVTCLDHRPCRFEFNNSGLVGTIQQTKEEMVPVPPHDKRDNAGAWKAEALKPFEVDGWKTRQSALENYHCWVRQDEGQECQPVKFFRNVPKVR